MPQKVCGGDILHVMAYQFVFEMPPNRTYNMLHIHLRFFPHFQNQIEMGHFKVFQHKKVGYFEERTRGRL